MSQWMPTDTERLEWLEKTFSGVSNRERYLPVQMIWGKGANGRTLREAIDKYMALDKKRPDIQKGNEDLVVTVGPRPPSVTPVELCTYCMGTGNRTYQSTAYSQCPRCLGTGRVGA